MSSLSHSPQPLSDEQNQELILHQDSQIIVNQEILIQNNPNSETLPLEDVPEEDDEAAAEENLKKEILEEIPAISSGMPLPMTDLHVYVPRRGSNKRKKGKGKGKLNAKKQLIIKKKLQSLMKNLKPMSFIPHKILDFTKHEKLMRKLGLWDFVHIDFDRNLRLDFLAQLVATYESRFSFVNGCRIGVNRAEFARAFKIPTKKDKGNVEVDLDFEPLSEESIGFLMEFVSDWVLLHEDDAWMMPNEVMNWLKVIKDGHPEKIDWAGLIWFMVEKELMQGENLKECYYASHLQYLMKEQKVLLSEEDPTVKYLLNVDANEVEEVNDANGTEGDGNYLIGGPSVKLTLGGQDDDKNENDAEMVDFEKFVETGKDGLGDEHGQWLMHGKNDMGVHFMQRCSMEKGRDFVGVEDTKVKEERMEFVGDDEENGGKSFNFPDDDTFEEDGLTGNFLQAIDGSKIVFNSQVGETSMDVRIDQQMDVSPSPSFFNQQAGKRVMIQQDNFFTENNKRLRINDSFSLDNKPTDFGMCLEKFQESKIAFNSQVGETSMDVRIDQQMDVSPSPSFFNQQAGKRVMIQQDNIFTESNKRLRINDSFSLDNKPTDFGMCLEKFQETMLKAKMCYEEKEQALEQSNVNQQILLNELQKRDDVIELLHKSKYEEIQKKDGEIYRYERELFIMGNILDGYRKALKETQKKFDKYREKAQLYEEPAYKDAGPGGLMLSIGEIERIRKKREDEYKMNCLIVEQKAKETEEHYVRQFEVLDGQVNMLGEKLIGFERDAKALIGLYAKRKVSQIDETQVTEPQVTAPMESVTLAIDESQHTAEETYELKSETDSKVEGISEDANEELVESITEKASSAANSPLRNGSEGPLSTY